MDVPAVEQTGKPGPEVDEQWPKGYRIGWLVESNEKIQAPPCPEPVSGHRPENTEAQHAKALAGLAQLS